MIRSHLINKFPGISRDFFLQARRFSPAIPEGVWSREATQHGGKSRSEIPKGIYEMASTRQYAARQRAAGFL